MCSGVNEDDLGAEAGGAGAGLPGGRQAGGGLCGGGVARAFAGSGALGAAALAVAVGSSKVSCGSAVAEVAVVTDADALGGGCESLDVAGGDPAVAARAGLLGTRFRKTTVPTQATSAKSTTTMSPRRRGRGAGIGGSAADGAGGHRPGRSACAIGVEPVPSATILAVPFGPRGSSGTSGTRTCSEMGKGAGAVGNCAIASARCLAARSAISSSSDSPPPSLCAVRWFRSESASVTEIAARQHGRWRSRDADRGRDLVVGLGLDARRRIRNGGEAEASREQTRVDRGIGVVHLVCDGQLPRAGRRRPIRSSRRCVRRRALDRTPPAAARSSAQAARRCPSSSETSTPSSSGSCSCSASASREAAGSPARRPPAVATRYSTSCVLLLLRRWAGSRPALSHRRRMKAMRERQEHGPRAPVRRASARSCSAPSPRARRVAPRSCSAPRPQAAARRSRRPRALHR